MSTMRTQSWMVLGLNVEPCVKLNPWLCPMYLRLLLFAALACSPQPTGAVILDQSVRLYDTWILALHAILLLRSIVS
jgi:hypothetical protein